MTAAAVPDDAPRLADLTPERLAEISRYRGVDEATTVLYHAIRSGPEHAGFIAAVDAEAADPPTPPCLDAQLLVAPAALYREKPEYGGDGRLVRRVAERFGVSSELLPVASAGSVAENAGRIAERLAAGFDRPVILVSLSKGAADLRVALETLGDRPRGLVEWVQICGLVHGSPYADVVLASRFKRWLFTSYVGRFGGTAALLEELSARPGARLSRPFVPPAGLRVINVVGFPLTGHLGWNARRRHAAMAALGPSDGGALLRTAFVEPGPVYPVWGADHYFRIPEAEALLTRLFAYIARTTRGREAAA